MSKEIKHISIYDVNNYDFGTLSNSLDYILYFTSTTDLLIYTKRVIGYSAFEINKKNNELYLHGIIVSKKYKNHGYGTKLLNKLEDIARKNNINRIIALYVNYESKEFFVKNGYKIYDPIRNDYIKIINNDIKITNIKEDLEDLIKT